MKCTFTFEPIVVGGEATESKLRTGFDGRLSAAEEEQIETFAVTRAELLRGRHEPTIVAIANGDAANEQKRT